MQNRFLNALLSDLTANHSCCMGGVAGAVEPSNFDKASLARFMTLLLLLGTSFMLWTAANDAAQSLVKSLIRATAR